MKKSDNLKLFVEFAGMGACISPIEMSTGTTT